MTKVKHDRLLAALIGKLPAEPLQWPRAERIAWLQTMAMAFDVVYGPCAAIRIADDTAPDDGVHASDRRGDRGAADGMVAPRAGPAECHAPPPAPGAVPRFYVDRDGFAMADGRPVAMEDLPAGAVLWDERIGIESGDAAAILWRDVGTTRRALPAGVTLRPVFDES